MESSIVLLYFKCLTTRSTHSGDVTRTNETNCLAFQLPASLSREDLHRLVHSDTSEIIDVVKQNRCGQQQAVKPV